MKDALVGLGVAILLASAVFVIVPIYLTCSEGTKWDPNRYIDRYFDWVERRFGRKDAR